MKNKIILFVLLMAIIVSMTGCFGANIDKETIAYRDYEIQGIIFEERKGINLVYDSHTLIVYIKQITYAGYYIYTPYISENGLYYKYVDGELVEVVK